MQKYDVLIGGSILFSNETDYRKVSLLISYLGYKEVEHNPNNHLQFNKYLQLTEPEFQEISDQEKEKLQDLLDKNHINYRDIILSAVTENIP